MKHHLTPANVQALSKALSTLLMDALFVTLLRVRFRDFQQVCATPKVTHVCKKNLQSATKQRELEVVDELQPVSFTKATWSVRCQNLFCGFRVSPVGVATQTHTQKFPQIVYFHAAEVLFMGNGHTAAGARLTHSSFTRQFIAFMAEVLPWIGNTMASARSYTWQILTSVVLGSKSFQFWGVQDVLLITRSLDAKTLTLFRCFNKHFKRDLSD